MMLTLKTELKKYFSPSQNLFDQMMALHGETFRALENRRTQKIVLGGKNYFIKQHFGIGWKEIFKNLLQFRFPVISAKNEWKAIQQLSALGIAVPNIVGYGARGKNPAHMQSFIMTEELPDHTSLEDYCRHWKTQTPTFASKQTLIRNVAHIARTLHENGINHRDFYLCHFLLEKTQHPSLFLIDLHRAQSRKHVPRRWVIKDLAGLYFSSKDIGLTNRDFLRFMREYRKKPLLTFINKEAAFWQKVKYRGDKLYQRHAN